MVRELDAHAWIEAYLPRQGWVEADPTPAAELAALHAGLKQTWTSAAGEWLAAKWAELSTRLGGLDWGTSLAWLWGQIKGLFLFLLANRMGWGLILLAGLLAVAVRFRPRKRARTRRQHAAPSGAGASASREMAELMRRLDALWARRGWARPASRAPLEHLAAIPQEKIPPDLSAACRKVVECFYRHCFAGAEVLPGEIEDLKRALDLTRMA